MFLQPCANLNTHLSRQEVKLYHLHYSVIGNKLVLLLRQWILEYVWKHN